MFNRRLSPRLAAASRLENDLKRLVEGFSVAMIDKLLLKHQEGFKGWGSKKNVPLMKAKLLEHVLTAEKPADYVDVANFAAFLWFIKRKKQRRSKR